MQVVSGVEAVKFLAGDVIFYEGDAADGLYLVVVGKFEISRMEDGNKVVLAECGAESVFGEMAIIDGLPRSATVQAIEVTECLKGTTEKFGSLIESLDFDVKNVMQQMVSAIRTKNLAHKSNLTPGDLALLNSIKQQAEQLRNQISDNGALLDKVRGLNPFINSIFNSLFNLLNR